MNAVSKSFCTINDTRFACLEVGVFSSLDQSIRKELARLGDLQELPRGTYLTQQGQRHGAIFVISQGSVSISCHAHGDTIHLEDIGRGGIVGEMAFLDERPASANVVIQKQSAVLWTVSHDRFRDFVHGDPEITIGIHRSLSREFTRRLRYNAERLLQRQCKFRSRFLDMDY